MNSSYSLDKWLEASKGLGLEIVPNYSLIMPNDSVLEAVFLLKNFGAKNGMLIFGRSKGVYKFGDYLVDEQGYGISILRVPKKLAKYDREGLIDDILKDWGWSGASDLEPEWLK